MQGMMDSPQFTQQMSAMMSNPAILDQIIATDPNLRAMGPQIRQMMQSDQFRNLVSDPERMRSMFQMMNQMRAAGIVPPNPYGPGGFGGAGGDPSTGAAPNAFASLFAPPPAADAPATTPTANPTSPGGTGAPAFNPFALDPAAMQQMMAGLGGLGAGGLGNPWDAFGPPGGASATPAVAGPPPEERFQTQLQVN